MLCYARLSFNFSFIHDIPHSIHFILVVSHYVTLYVSAPFPHFYTLIGSSDSLNLHIQIYGCYILLIM